MQQSEIAEDEFALSFQFQDVLQLRAAYAFRKRGVSAQLLRKAIVRGGELIDSDRLPRSVLSLTHEAMRRPALAVAAHREDDGRIRPAGRFSDVA